MSEALIQDLDQQPKSSNMLFNDRLIFIVGNSRSGTTMMMRILKLHPKIHSLNELHFFEKLWSTSDRNRPIDVDEAIWTASRLFFIDKYNVLKKFEFDEFAPQAKTLISQIDKHPLFRQDIYQAFLNYQTQQKGKEIACEKTPQNLFYVKELLQMYPNCKIINLVRDPRAVLLSQKKKWMRKNSSDSYIQDHKKEVLRLRINYHPITISRLWNSAIQAIDKHIQDERVKMVRFEDITNKPNQTLSEVCEFLEVPFDPGIMQVEYNGSSTELRKGEKEFGIKKNTVAAWKKGLTKGEIFMCQWITGGYYERFGFEKMKVGVNPIAVIYQIISFPVKLFLAVLMNLNRMRNIKEAIKRRLFA